MERPPTQQGAPAPTSAREARPLQRAPPQDDEMYGQPSQSAGGARLVAAMEHVDRVVNAFVEDIGRAVAQVRAEVAAERDVSLSSIARAQNQLDDAYQTLQAEKADFETHRVAIETELERRWNELKNAQERDKEERAQVEREIREMSQRAAAETQAAALIQMQASQAAQAAALGLGTTGMMGMPGSSHGMPAMPGSSHGVPGMPGMPGMPTTMTMPGMPSTMTPRANAAPTQREPDPGPVPGPQLVFAVGGLQRASSPLRSAEVYEVESGGWRLLPEMRTERGYLAVAHAGRSSGAGLLALGGSDGKGALASCEAFDYRAGEWREIASMSRPRIWLGAATVGDHVFAAGGYDGQEYLDLVEVYRPGPPEAKPGSVSAAGRWERCRSLSSGRSTLGLVGCLGTLYAVGGFTAPHYLSTCEAYDPNADQWWGVAPLGAPRRDLGLAAIEHRHMLVAAGGYDGRKYLGAVEAMDPRINRWRPLANLRKPRQLLALCAKGDQVWAMGGFDGKEGVRTVEVYDARADKWTDAAPMSTPRLGLGACCA